MTLRKSVARDYDRGRPTRNMRSGNEWDFMNITTVLKKKLLLVSLPDVGHIVLLFPWVKLMTPKLIKKKTGNFKLIFAITIEIYTFAISVFVIDSKN